MLPCTRCHPIIAGNISQSRIADPFEQARAFPFGRAEEREQFGRVDRIRWAIAGAGRSRASQLTWNVPRARAGPTERLRALTAINTFVTAG
jgi:hypothetical protein